MKPSTILCPLAVALTLATACSAATRYDIEDIGPVSSVAAINNQGEVLANNINRQPFLFRKGQPQLLPQPSAGAFTANALNDFGEIVGYVNLPGSYDFYLAVYRNGQLRVLNEISGVSPRAINNRGQIAGDLVKKYQTFIYSEGALTAFSPANTGFSATRGMNKKGDIVGLTSPGGSTQLGFLYRNGQFSTLAVPGAAYTEADAVNRKGEIAGMWNNSSTSFLPQVFICRKGVFQDLGHAFGQSVEQDTVTGLNRFGVIVGTGRTLTIPNGGFSAYAYFPEEGFAELNTLIASNSGWFLQSASGINDRGQITGVGLINGVQHGYILTPVCGAEENEDDQPDDTIE